MDTFLLRREISGIQELSGVMYLAYILNSDNMKWIVKCLALISMILTKILLAIEIFSVSRNFFPIKRWADDEKSVIREHYLMPTNQWGIVMFGDRTKPYQPIYEKRGLIHRWRWYSSKRFDGDNDGKNRIDSSIFSETAFSWGIAIQTAGSKKLKFYTDYYYINISFYRNISLAIACLSLLSLRFFFRVPDNQQT